MDMICLGDMIGFGIFTFVIGFLSRIFYEEAGEIEWITMIL